MTYNDTDTLGTARVHLRDPTAPHDTKNFDAVNALERYAEDARAIAGVAAALVAGRWEVTLSAILGFGIAELEADYLEAVRSAEALLPAGEVVDWFVGALPLGGFVAGQDTGAFGPGDPLPLLVINHLTGRQVCVDEEDQLRGAVAAALRECAGWWCAHPDEALDGDAAAIAAAIDEQADAIDLDNAPIPARWCHRAPARPLGPATVVMLLPESHLRWEGAKHVFAAAEHDDPRKWLVEDREIASSNYEGLAREVFAGGARDAAALLRA